MVAHGIPDIINQPGTIGAPGIHREIARGLCPPEAVSTQVKDGETHPIDGKAG
jgi:hypothetical protein